MQWLVEYFRSLFCVHRWELVDEYAVRDDYDTVRDYALVFMCKRCGRTKVRHVAGWWQR